MFDVGLLLYILIYLVEYVKKFRRKLSQVASSQSASLSYENFHVNMSTHPSKPCTYEEELFLLVKGFE